MITLNFRDVTELVPENKKDYYVLTTYGAILPANCEIHYMERSFEDGSFTGASTYYSGDSVPFDVPLVFDDDGVPYVISDSEFKHMKSGGGVYDEKEWLLYEKCEGMGRMWNRESDDLLGILPMDEIK